MTDRWRWDPCVSHRGEEARAFLTEYLAGTEKCTLLICGAGFDPRAADVSELLVGVPNVTGFFIKEERPNACSNLRQRAAQNVQRMRKMIPNSNVEEIDIFARDGAVVGGKKAVKALADVRLDHFSDVVVDVSALSIGIAFPIVRFLYECRHADDTTANLHVVVMDTPRVDQAIRSQASDRAEFIAGFRGSFGLEESSQAVKLWLPQLVRDRHAVLDRMYEAISPDEVCPILPFPSTDPRYADELIEHYSVKLESTWNIDSRSVV